jgi:integrase
MKSFKIQKENHESIKKVEEESDHIMNSGISSEDKMTRVASLIIEKNAENRTIMKKGFVGLAVQNAELNEKLMNKNEALEKQTKQLQGKLEMIAQELHERKEKEILVEQKKERWKKRTRLPKKQPITIEIYRVLIEESDKLNYAKSYRGVRLRIALALLVVTGARISELLQLKMGQVQTLFTEQWISIDRSKRGPSNHKAFLTKEGAKIMRERLLDLEFLWRFKDKNSYIFTPENLNKPLERETFTALINKFIKASTRKIGGNPNLSSHSFRVGFITKLWRDTNDIEFVRQAIGHAKIDTTSQYVKNLLDDERPERMKSVDTKCQMSE